MLSSKTTEKDMNLARAALADALRDTEKLPFRFQLDGKTHKGIPAAFSPRADRRILNADLSELTYTAEIPGTPLTLRFEGFAYKDAAVYEWTVWFENTGSEDSPVISEFFGCDLLLPTEDRAFLSHNNGDYCSRDGLETTVSELTNAGDSFATEPVGGRSCDRAWPYYRLMSNSFGYNLAIGWPGVWQSNFTREKGGVRFCAKQKFTNFFLKPGEKVRSPRIVLMAFEGEEERGINCWRRWYFAHVVPRTKGRKLTPKICYLHNGGGEEFTKADEKNQIDAINTFIKRGEKPDIWWLDAGWYPCADDKGEVHWWHTGKWYPDPARWPRGLAPVGECCEENGIQFLLWFEVERVHIKWWPKEYPEEFLLRISSEDKSDWAEGQGLFYLGNPKARRWMTDLIESVLSEGKVKIYRQDFNATPFPLPWWLQNDGGEKRLGITENLHTQGYLQMWDDLLFDIPDLWIDSCASGGRRNDIEAMRRAVPLHPTDYGYGEHPVKQAFQKTWYEWTPYFRSIAESWDDEDGNYNAGKPGAHGYDSYAGHCAFAPATTFGANAYDDEEKFARAAAFRKLWQKAAPYTLDSDFYCLTPVRKSNEDWFSIQFHREEEKDGILQVIRNTRAPAEELTVFPRGFEEGKTYLFDSPEYRRSFTLKGAEINEKGITFALPKRSGEIWFYKEQK